MEFEYLLKNEPFKVKIDKKEEIYLLEVNGEKQEIKATNLSDNLISLLYKDKSCRVFMAEAGDDSLLCSMNGVHYELFRGNDKSTKNHGAGAEEEFSGEIITPMPGKVVKIFVKKEQPVKAGDNIIVVEAMKMEHTLSTPKDGLISDIFVSEGENTAFGQILVKIKLAEVKA